MTFTPHFCDQRSLEWYQLRVWMLTGSSANGVIKERQRGSGELKEKTTLRRRLVAEQLTGLSAESTFVSDAMQHGIDLEPAAFVAYEAETGQIVRPVGFVSHVALKAGCSPDGYVGEWEGLIELKCPLSTTHLEYIQGGAIPDEYRGQLLHALWLTGAQWIDFCSFDERFPEHLQLFRVRLERNEFELAAYGRTIEAFLSEVETEVERLKALRMVAA